jgi:hypothetical protein
MSLFGGGGGSSSSSGTYDTNRTYVKSAVNAPTAPQVALTQADKVAAFGVQPALTGRRADKPSLISGAPVTKQSRSSLVRAPMNGPFVL